MTYEVRAVCCDISCQPPSQHSASWAAPGTHDNVAACFRWLSTAALWVHVDAPHATAGLLHQHAHPLFVADSAAAATTLPVKPQALSPLVPTHQFGVLDHVIMRQIMST